MGRKPTITTAIETVFNRSRYGVKDIVLDTRPRDPLKDPLKLICMAIEKGAPQTEVCKYTGINNDSWRAWISYGKSIHDSVNQFMELGHSYDEALDLTLEKKSYTRSTAEKYMTLYQEIDRAEAKLALELPEILYEYVTTIDDIRDMTPDQLKTIRWIMSNKVNGFQEGNNQKVEHTYTITGTDDAIDKLKALKELDETPKRLQDNE